LNELITNAVDHGLLGLDSSLKTGPEGLSRYFALREERLRTLSRASLQIRICRREIPGAPARIALELRDSGSGFDHAEHLAQADEALRQARAHACAPRGLALVLDLCDCLVYEDAGRTVRVEFPGQ
jgi:anti-sigma regulatory factor (Ser/Thr protein kinase)